MRSSLGFHTMSLSLPVDNGEYSELIYDFLRYNEKHHSFRMYYPDKEKNNNPYYYSSDYYDISDELRIAPVKYEGIIWRLRNRTSYSSNAYIYVTINPKFLAGFTDYITAANIDDMSMAITRFNEISRSISPLLKIFQDYRITRIDYCINFALDELIPGCSVEQMMDLIKRSNIPSHFMEWANYDEISHKYQSKPSSFYLTNGSVHLNCYSKYMKLLEQQERNKVHGYAPIPQYVLEDSKYIIRFEIQFKYNKVYRLSNSFAEPEDAPPNKYPTLLDPAMCEAVIKSYYQRSIGYGNWYSLTNALAKVQATSYNAQRKERLCDVLKLINDRRSVRDAKAILNRRQLAIFKLTLKELSGIGVNPVTIPREWGVSCIHNLLEEFFLMRDKEKDLMLASLIKK